MSTRYAVYDTVNDEILAANYLVPGAANNHAELDYYKPVGLIIVKTVDDIIIGQCDKRGHLLKRQQYKFGNRSIWQNKTSEQSINK